MRFGAAKTTDERNLVYGAVKKDKTAALGLNVKQSTFQKELLVIHGFCLRYPNSGATKRLLSEFLKRIESDKNGKRLAQENPKVLVAILMDIAAISPIVFPAVASLVSRILNGVGAQEKRDIFELILKKTSRIPNNGYMEIWLQRIAWANKLNFQGKEQMCDLKTLRGKLWNFEWVGDKTLRSSLQRYSIVDETKIENLTPYIERSEFDAFWNSDSPSL